MWGMNYAVRTRFRSIWNTPAILAIVRRSSFSMEARRPWCRFKMGGLRPIPFKQMVDPVSGRAKVRMVDITAQSYQIARQYMIRLSDEDFKDPVGTGPLCGPRGTVAGGISQPVSACRFECEGILN